ncbi:MAG TPA: DUF488 domain-containing protein [Bacillota bacterium]
MPDILYTIGFAQKSLRRFIQLLEEAGVKKLVDIRLNNTSQLAGFAKKADLMYICELFGIQYEHVTELAPDEKTLEIYKLNRNWKEYEDSFGALLQERNAATVLERTVAMEGNTCLLCAEPKADRCHRRLVAELYQKAHPGVIVRHLS